MVHPMVGNYAKVIQTCFALDDDGNRICVLSKSVHIGEVLEVLTHNGYDEYGVDTGNSWCRYFVVRDDVRVPNSRSVKTHIEFFLKANAAQILGGE